MIFFPRRSSIVLEGLYSQNIILSNTESDCRKKKGGKEATRL